MRRLLGPVLLVSLLAAAESLILGQETNARAPAHLSVRAVALVLAAHDERMRDDAARRASPTADPRAWPHQLDACPPPDRLGSGQPWPRPLAPLHACGFIVEEYEPDLVGRGPWRRCWDAVVNETLVNCGRFGHDLRHLYTGENLAYLGIAVALTAPLAFSSADEDVSQWYQAHVRSRRTDEWARAGNVLGDHKYTVPIYLGVMAAGMYWQDTPAGGVAYTWSNRTLRALAVGAPAVGALQYGLGAHRPSEGDARWRPFVDRHSVAGHGFVAAMPFLAAASMTDNRLLKTAFFAGSFWGPWARLNDDGHFLSQCILGWSIAYLSARSVSRTDWQERAIHVTPIEEYGGVGMGLCIRY